MSNSSVSTCSGTFYDSGGSGGSYASGENYSMTFSSSNHNRLQFNFQSFSTESGYDYLYIYDGPSTAYPLIGQYSGTSSPGIINSSDTSLTFRFTSDGSNTSTGWSATISCTTAPIPAYNMTSGTITTCNAIFYDNAGPAANYINNENREMTFTAAASQYLICNFVNFNIYADDTLFVYDGTSSASPLIGKYFGSILPEVIYSKTGTSLTFKFISNGVNTAPGWKAELTCGSSAPTQNFIMQPGIRYTCGGAFYDSGGSGGSYGASESKTMTFYSDNGNRINFNFQTFSTESCCDYLRIFDGPSTSSPLIGQFGGTTSPGSVTSTGTSLTFYFYSDGTNVGIGWNANISCTTAPLTVYNMSSGTVNTCSGVFYDNGGASSSYPNNENREMTFCSGTSDYITFTFQPNNFNVYSDDTLYAYDGSNSSSPLIGAYTGTQVPEVIASKTGSCVTFKFKSNSANTYAGWQAIIGCSATPVTNQTFTMQPGTRYTCSGTFYDSGGNVGSYGVSESKTMTFYSDNGNRIQFSFQSLSTESGYDYLRIYDGPSTSYPLIGQYGGTTSPGTVTSTGTSLTFYFYSDASNVATGWSANISCTSAPLTVYNMSSGTVNTCSGVFYDNGGPGTSYANNENRVMTFCSGTSDYITFTFQPYNFNVYLDDTLYAYDGPNTTSPLIGAYTGAQIPEIISSKAGSCVTFRFKSNSANTYAGWQAIIGCSTTPVSNQTFTMQPGIRYTCGGTFYDSGGNVGSYGVSESKTMTFYSDNGNRISFNFQSFSTESCCDYLRIYDGPSTSYPLIGQYLGTTSPGAITSTGTSLTFYFYSDASNVATGWSANISCTSAPLIVYNMSSGTVNTCSGVFYDNGGPAASYPNNENRVQTFCSDAGNFIKFNFTQNNFNINTDDSLFVYDGQNTSSALIAILTGSTIPEEISSVTGSCLTFKFKSNSANIAAGWQGLISCSNNASSSPMTYNMSNGVRYNCNARFYDSGGSAGSYGNSESKTQAFCSNSGCPISVIFSALGTESGVDLLKVYNGLGTTGTLLGTYSGSTVPPTLTSSSSCLTFNFYSDVSINGIGWNAILTCDTASITPSPSLSACQGDTVTLTANLGTSYLWSNGMTSQSIHVIASGIYSVTVTSAGGCNLVSAPANVVVKPRPVASVSAAGSTTFCPGGNVQLNGSGGASYHWNTGSTSSSIIAGSAGDYWVTATSNGCSDVSDSIHVAVYTAPPTPTIMQSNDTLYANPSVGYTYQWYLNSSVIGGATNNYYHPVSNGLYSVQITDVNSCVKTSSPYNYVWVGLSEFSDNMGISLYPNPFGDYATLSVDLNENNFISIEIWDLLGQKVSVIDNSERCKGTLKYNIDKQKLGLLAGSYFICVHVKDSFSVLKVMVQ